MTLNASGPISLGGSTAGQSINLELSKSATATVSLNDTDVRTLAGVASGAIVMPTNFYGKSSVVISITDQYIPGLGISDAYAFYILTAGGQVEQSIEAGGINPTNLEQWCTPTAQASNYEALVTLTAGTLSGGSGAGTWLALSTTRTWYVEEFTPGGSKLCQFTVQIRKIGTTTVLDTATIDLEATVI
jgi:hypothetical protein